MLASRIEVRRTKNSHYCTIYRINRKPSTLIRFVFLSLFSLLIRLRCTQSPFKVRVIVTLPLPPVPPHLIRLHFAPFHYTDYRLRVHSDLMLHSRRYHPCC